MITQEEKNARIEELESLISTNFTSLDVVRFVQENEWVQCILRDITYCDYDEELRYILGADDSDIEYMLSSPHTNFYDSNYGSEDPVSHFRISKSEYDTDADWTLDGVREMDNIFTHILNALDNELIELNDEELLVEEKLNQLYTGEADCVYKQIYLFVPGSKSDFRFLHYYKTDSEWDYNEISVDFDDFYRMDELFDDIMGESVSDPILLETLFFGYFENQYLHYIEPGSGLPLSKAVFNGVESINQLKDFSSSEVRQYAPRFKVRHRLEIEIASNNLLHRIYSSKKLTPLLEVSETTDRERFQHLVPTAEKNAISLVNSFLDVISPQLNVIANRFNRFMDGGNFKRFNNLMFVLNELPHIHINPGYEFDAFYEGDDYGKRFRTYCCQRGAKELYDPDKSIYQDNLRISGCISFAAAKSVPEALSYFSVPFTEVGIMEAWLLYRITDFMPRTWHAMYGSRSYIFRKGCWNSMFPASISSTGAFERCILESRLTIREEVIKYNEEDLFPTISIDGDEATLTYCYWNDWRGLVKASVNVSKHGDGVSFDKPEEKVLLEFSCGIDM